MILMFKSENRSGFLRNFIVTFLVAIGAISLLFFIVSGIIQGDMFNPESPGIENEGIPMPQQIAAEETNNQSITEFVAKSASPGVVGISVLKVDSSSIFDGNAVRKWGLGSGIIIKPDGYVLTNHHVAGEKNSRIIVHLEDGRDVEGLTIWSDSVLDLAIVKINVTGLISIPLGDANKLKVGEPAIAIGNPLGLQFQRTVTSGIISALNRTISIETERGQNYMEDLIQTDAGINPGNSGGPLLNSKGEVVGINTVKVESAEAIGFAVPVNVIIPVIEKITEHGEFVEPYLGIFAYDREVVPYLDGKLKIEKGIYVTDVDESGPAYNNGIRLGCVITEIDGNDINTMMQLRCYIYSKNPGDTVHVTYLSHDKSKTETVAIKLSQRNGNNLVTR
jgi:serine protease Do